MFGTVAKMKFKPGMAKKFREEMEADISDPDPGTVAVYAFEMKDNPDIYYMVAIAESEEAYVANADRPETHQRFMRMMEYLESEPEWHDGPVVYSRKEQ